MADQTGALKHTFGAIAERYNAVRPGYPNAIADALLGRAACSESLHVLEIGCGTGQATRLFGERGHEVLATDLSAELLAVAAQQLAAWPNVRFQATAFEQLDEAQRYDVVVSAQAFHWIDPLVGLPKAQRLLWPNGVLGLFWNFFHYDATPESQRLRDILVTHMPHFAGWPDSSDAAYHEFAERWTELVADAHGFGAVEQRHVLHVLTYTQDDFTTLLSTFSWFQTAPEHAQHALLGALGDALPPHNAPLQLPVRTLLISALRTND